MNDAGVQVVWQIGGSALAGWPAAATARSNRAARTSQPKRCSLKIWVGMQAELERERVVGQFTAACSTNPLGCVGYRQSAQAGPRGRGRNDWSGEMQRVEGQVCTRVPYLRAAGGIGDGLGRQAGLTRACVSSGSVGSRTIWCGCVQLTCAGGSRSIVRCWLATVTSTWSCHERVVSAGSSPVICGHPRVVA
jgi:hypothetical protein